MPAIMSASPDKRGPRIGHVGSIGYVERLMSTDAPAVTMYTTSWCGYCVRLKKVLKKDEHGAGAAILLTLAVPLILAFQGWDDHDRSLKTSARDLAMNYLKSCQKNGIIFTNGDNDTFPLWYMQEV